MADRPHRYKNYEAAYAKGLAVTDSKNYGATDSASESNSSIAQIKQGDGNAAVGEDDEDPEVGALPCH